jgi:hypothetical protein
MSIISRQNCGIYAASTVAAHWTHDPKVKGSQHGESGGKSVDSSSRCCDLRGQGKSMYPLSANTNVLPASVA